MVNVAMIWLIADNYVGQETGLSPWQAKGQTRRCGSKGSKTAS